MDKLRVLELYPAVQGEGSLIGQPSTFLRFSGCSVGCTWCDTKYSWKFSGGTDYEPEEILNNVYALGLPSLVVTGGEPFEQPKEPLGEFIEGLETFYISQLTFETSGVFKPPAALTNTQTSTLLSIAPKLASADSNYDFPDLTPFFIVAEHNPNVTLQFKFVVDPNSLKFNEDMVFIDGLIQKNLFGFHEYPIIFTPVTHFNRDPEIVRNQVARDLAVLHKWFQDKGWTTWRSQFRILPQLHAMIYGSKKGI